MRDWTKVLLALCVVALGAGMFVLERRISGLEAQLLATRPEMIATSTTTPAMRVAVNESQIEDFMKQRRAIEIQPPQKAAPRVERQPSGVINGIPYYIVPLKDGEG